MTIFNEFIPKLKNPGKQPKLKTSANPESIQKLKTPNSNRKSEMESKIDEIFRETQSFLQESVEINNSMSFLENILVSIKRNRIQRLPSQYEQERVLNVSDFSPARVTADISDDDNEKEKEKLSDYRKNQSPMKPAKNRSIIERNKRQLTLKERSKNSTKSEINPAAERKTDVLRKSLQQNPIKKTDIPESTKLMLMEAKRKFMERNSSSSGEVSCTSVDLKIM